MDLLSDLRSRTSQMTGHLRALVEAESPSSDLDLVTRCSEVISSLAVDLLGSKPELLSLGGRSHVLHRLGGRTRVLVVGHFDTVWPAGTIRRWPFQIDGDRATGPGAFDMKAGIVQGLHALSALGDLDGVTVLLTSDEELGSPTSAGLIRELAGDAEAALVLEPSTGGALKIERKGVSVFRIEITGRAAHAGLEPEKGRNALVELAHQVLALGALQDDGAGTTVTPTVAKAGTVTNVVPASATIEVDVRVSSVAEQKRISAAIKALKPMLDGTELHVDADENRPPLERAATADLFARAERIAAALGLDPPRGVGVGGGSDGNFTAAAGCPTLDGLGAVGDGAHAEGEYVLVSEMAPRAALFGALVEDILGGDRG